MRKTNQKKLMFRRPISLFFLLLMLIAMLRATDFYVTSLSDRVFFTNLTGTPLDAAALETARLACAADPICAYLAVQNNGPYIGTQQWTYLTTHNPPWTPYPYAETPLFAALDGLTFGQINALVGVFKTIDVNVITPSCPIGSTPFWNTVTNEQQCISQTDRALEYNIVVYFFWYGFVLVLVLCGALLLYYASYLPYYLKNVSFKGEAKKSL